MTLPETEPERSSHDQRTEPLESYVAESNGNSIWKISSKNLPLFQ